MRLCEIFLLAYMLLRFGSSLWLNLLLFEPLSNALYCVVQRAPSPTTHTPHRKVNLRGVFLGSKYACTQFLKQDLSPSGHRGWIINTSSGAGLKGVAGGASKSSRPTAPTGLRKPGHHR